MNELVSIILLQNRDLNKFKDFIRIFRYQTYTNYKVFISLKNNNLYSDINLYLEQLNDNRFKIIYKSLKNNKDIFNYIINLNGEYFTILSDLDCVFQDHLKILIGDYDLSYSKFNLLNGKDVNYKYENHVDLYNNYKGIKSFMWKLSFLKKIIFFEIDSKFIFYYFFLYTFFYSQKIKYINKSTLCCSSYSNDFYIYDNNKIVNNCPIKDIFVIKSNIYDLVKKEKIISSKISLKNYFKNIKIQYFPKKEIIINVYSKDFKIIKLLNIFNEIHFVSEKKADFVFLNENDKDYIEYLGKKGIFVFNTKQSHFPNSYFHNYNIEVIIYKLYYFKLNNLKDDIINSVNKYILNKIPTDTIVFVPIWGRHEILELCIKTYQNQTEKCIIFGICSNDIDKKFAESLGIKSFFTSNIPLSAKYQMGFDISKIYFPKNVIITGSDDSFTNNYIENINKYVDNYDIVGLRNWKVSDIENKDSYLFEYIHPIIKNNWGGVNSVYRKTFNTKEVGFNVNKIKKFPFSIGAGRSLGYKLLNRINWQVYPNKVDSLLDTISLFKLLMLNNASFITLKTTDFFIISIKKSDKNVINTLHDLKISKNISYSIL